MGEMRGKREGEITWGETDDDYDKRNWIWLKDNKVLSLNSNIKAIAGWENYETLKKKS